MCHSFLPDQLPDRAPFPHHPQSLQGHGNDIHDIAVHPSSPALVLTASKDESVRLWNLSGPGCCVAVFKVRVAAVGAL